LRLVLRHPDARLAAGNAGRSQGIQDRRNRASGSNRRRGGARGPTTSAHQQGYQERGRGPYGSSPCCSCDRRGRTPPTVESQGGKAWTSAARRRTL
jgi:hypothetical protein